MALVEPLLLAIEHSPTLTRKVPEFAYLYTENSRRYRPIMRFFYLRHSAHRYWLSAEQIISHMQEKYDPHYTAAMVEEDLTFLFEHQNLIREQDAAKAVTVEDFLRKRFLYQITPYSVEIERTVISFEHGEGGSGSLDTTRLETLWANFVQLREFLQRPPATPDQRWLQTLHRHWQEAYETFERIRKDATDFFAAIHRSRPDDFQDITKYLGYKTLLTDYLRQFISDLMNHKDKMRGLLLQWQESSSGTALVEYLTHYHATFVPSADGTLPDRGRLRERFDGQYGDLLDWFQITQGKATDQEEGVGSLDMLRQVTLGAIEQITMQAARLSDRRQIGMSRRQDLERLARTFAACDTRDQAHRLFALAFGVSAPRHILGTRSDIVMTQAGSVWQQPPFLVPLSSITRGRPERGGGSPIRNRQHEKAALLEATKEKRVRELAFWDSLFETGEINIGALTLSDERHRDRLLELLGQCLTASDGSAIASDGSRVELIRPKATAPYGQLAAPDGILIIPQYRLRRKREESIA